MQIKLALGLNMVDPPHELAAQEDGFIECSKLQNYICKDNKVTKVKGTESYNTELLPGPVPWIERSYHKLADGSFRKVTFAFSQGTIYVGNDVEGTFQEAKSGFSFDVIPSSSNMQIAENSTLFFFSGNEEVVKYDGNGAYTFAPTSIATDIGRMPISATVHLDRMWYVSKNSSKIIYSDVLNPETFNDGDDITIGEETDSSIIAIEVGPDGILYIFKNQSIWRLTGRSPATFAVQQVSDRYGLTGKRAIVRIPGGFAFQDSFTHEIYTFSGTDQSVKNISEKKIGLRDIVDKTEVGNTIMTVHNNLFRCAFKHREDTPYMDREIVYSLTDPSPLGLPMWSMIKGSKVYCYSSWNQQGDGLQLVTGRSDTGKIMYHDRGYNFDGEAIETIVRTGETQASEDKVVRFSGFMVQGKPGSIHKQCLFRYFLNGRYSDRGEEGLDMDGETIQKGIVYISTQGLFNDRIVPMSDYSRGNSIAFEIYDNNTGTFMEVYSISFSASERYKIRNQLI